jgi:hypothetical protein
MSEEVPNVIVISDTHGGCSVALCPPTIRLDSGGIYHIGPTQRKIWDFWQQFWKWVDVVTRGEPYCVVHNGDALDGAHHASKTQLSQNFSDQANVAYEILAPVVEKCQGRYYHIRGTEAHVGQCAENEEMLAKRLGAIRDGGGNASRYDLWLRVGDALCHFTHHIGATSSHAYQSSAPMREMSELLINAALWGHEPPDIVVRSHRHQNIEIREPSRNKYGVVFTTAGWQAKTPYVWKIPGGRTGDCQIGGSLIRCGDEEAYTRHFVSSLGRSIVCEVPGQVIGGKNNET